MAKFFTPPAEDADTGNFVFYSDPNQIATSGDASIVVESVPGSLSLSAYDGIVLQYSTAAEDNGVFIQDKTNPDNRVATVGDVESALLPYSIGSETSYTVQGGTTGTQPTFDGDPLFNGSFVQLGDLVFFNIEVDFDNITSFGTGQYYVSLPVQTKYELTIRNGSLHDFSNSNRSYHITGEAEAGSNLLYLYTTDIDGQRLYDFPFSDGEPFNLDQADHFHISGSFIFQPSFSP